MTTLLQLDFAKIGTRGEKSGYIRVMSYNHHEAKRHNVLLFSIKHTQQAKSAALVSDVSPDAR